MMNDNGCVYVVEIKGEQYVEYKTYERRVNDLCRQIDELEYKINTLRTRCHESVRDAFDKGNYGALHIVTADELKKSNSNTDFETDRLVRLPFDAMETANMLINATYKEEIPFLERQVDRNVYNIDDLEQIAEHLIVYCKHHKNSEE